MAEVLNLSFEELKNELNEIEKSSQLGLEVNSRYKDIFIGSSKAMIMDIEKAQQDEKQEGFNPNEQLLRDVRIILSDSIAISIMENNSEYTWKCFSIYCLLAGNWGRLIQNDDIIRLSGSLDKFRELVNSTDTLIYVVREVTKKLEITNGRRPNYYDINKTYLSRIKESIKNKLEE